MHATMPVEVRGQPVGVSSLFYCVDPHDQIQTTKLGGKPFYLLSHPASPQRVLKTERKWPRVQRYILVLLTDQMHWGVRQPSLSLLN